MAEIENIRSTANTLKEQAAQLASTCSKLAEVFRTMTACIDTTDSNLREEVNYFDYYYTELANKSYKIFESYSDGIVNWVEFTSKLEAETSSKLQQITAGLNDISGLISKLR